MKMGCGMNILCLIILIALITFNWACDSNNRSAVPIYSDVYYVSTDGNDNNLGTIDSPWATWQKAFAMADFGDTVYIRGGVYYAQKNRENGVRVANKNGTKSNPICIFNYPEENPILDCSTIHVASPSNGVLFYDCSFYHLKGLTVTGLDQHSQEDGSNGFAFERGGPYTIERCVSHGNEGVGFFGYAVDTIYLIQCDSYDNFDMFNEGYSGGQADGYVFCYGSKISYTYYQGCRSWYNSDDGYDCWENEGTVIFNECWAFNNGRGDGDGCGFKLGKTVQKPLLKPQRILKNCLAFDNRYIGFNQNGGNVGMELYNNISYNNSRIGFDMGQFNNIIIVRNNISYKDEKIGYFITANNDHNSWNASTGVTITDDDFVSLDSTGVSGKRQPNGDLPKLDFLKLQKGSDLINAGADVGLPYVGITSDLGPYEIE